MLPPGALTLFVMSFPRVTRLVPLLALLVLLAAACGRGSEPPAEMEMERDDFSSDLSDADAYPYFISSEILVGENRFLIGLLDSNDAPFGSPDVEVDVRFFDLSVSDSEPVSEHDAEFAWTVEPERGLYLTYPTFSRPGEWGAEVAITGNGVDETVRGTFEVAEEGTTPALGAPAPASDTPTADDVKNLSEISTDPHPDPRFYRLSVAEALAESEPFVLVFATPEFCTSAVCGPTLDTVKEAGDRFRGITFIHSEIYEDLEPSSPPVEAVTEWGLPSEPWVFVVDGDGRVAAKYEGVATAKELRAELRNL